MPRSTAGTITVVSRKRSNATTPPTIHIAAPALSTTTTPTASTTALPMTNPSNVASPKAAPSAPKTRPRYSSLVSVCTNPLPAALMATAGKPAAARQRAPKVKAAGPGGASRAALARLRSARPEPDQADREETRRCDARRYQSHRGAGHEPANCLRREEETRSGRATAQDIDGEGSEAEPEGPLADRAESVPDEDRAERAVARDDLQTRPPLIGNAPPRRCLAPLSPAALRASLGPNERDEPRRDEEGAGIDQDDGGQTAGGVAPPPRRTDQPRLLLSALRALALTNRSSPTSFGNNADSAGSKARLTVPVAARTR